MPPQRARERVEIHGAVQGVGFRPFVYRLATELSLAGWVINDTRGVFIEVEGEKPALDAFNARLRTEKPPRAIVHSLDMREIAPLGEDSFAIRHSDGQGSKTALILPDVATCPDCLAEVFSPADRRHAYPFTNCTNCGPRFTIIEALPYDRPNTTMRGFTMCPHCQAEYDSPLDRRFHAQPNACPVCGPHVELWDATGRVLAERGDAVAGAVDALRAGDVVAVKGLGGFLLLADSANDGTLRRLRLRKPRRDKPFALMTPDLAWARRLCAVSAQAEDALLSPEAPIVLMPRLPDAPVSPEVAPDNPYLGVMLPYAPLHHLLLSGFGRPVVATSGNLSDEPICTDERDAVQRLGGMAERFLVHNRPIARHVDDSVAWLVDGSVRLLRRARGHAPLPVLVDDALPPILGVGAHLKNAIALSIDRQVFISQHIGDLETPEAMAAFESVIADLKRMYGVEPLVIAHDLHPDYLSTRWAQQQSGVRLAPVQHHHAHLAACLAENGVAGPALGVTWDGTGYGPDGTVWGGEFLLGDAAGFRRVAHLRPFLLPGGEAAVREPRRSAFGLLWAMYGEGTLAHTDLPPVAAFSPAERRTLGRMLQRRVNAPQTTSAGRLFDGVAALLGLHQTTSFEGQAAMALEFVADSTVADAYEFPMTGQPAQPAAAESAAPLVLDWRPVVEAVITDCARGVPVSVISARFHNALVELIVTMARAVGMELVALSGGCFQNRWLTERTAARLREAGLRPLLHRQTPPNDGCIALGQVVVAARQLTRRV